MAIPPYPSLAGFPVQWDSTGTIRFRPDPNSADVRNIDAFGLALWNESHAVDPSLGGAPYGSPQWDYQYRQNGRANSVGAPLPFPAMVGWESYFPAYKADATKEDTAPGETPFNQCDNYRKDGDLALADFRLKHPGLALSATVPGTVATRQQIEDNIRIDYNEAAKAFGCANVPYPEVQGKTRVVADPPPVVVPAPRPNLLNGQPIPVTGGGTPADATNADTAPAPAPTTPTGGGPPSVFTPGPAATVPAGIGAPGLDPRFSGPLDASTTAPAPSDPSPTSGRWTLVLIAAAVVFLAYGSKGDG